MGIRTWIRYFAVGGTITFGLAILLVFLEMVARAFGNGLPQLFLLGYLIFTLFAVNAYARHLGVGG